MALSIGIVGLPNAGKSSLFNELSRAGAPVAAYPFTTIDPYRGVVPVPDPRVDAIASVTHPERIVPARVEFVDIAGLVRGASRGEGLGNQFLAQIRDADAIAHVVRCFPDPEVPHVEGAVDPVRDIEIVETELGLADLAVVERALERARTRVKAHEPKAAEELAVLEEPGAAGRRRDSHRHGAWFCPRRGDRVGESGPRRFPAGGPRPRAGAAGGEGLRRAGRGRLADPVRALDRQVCAGVRTGTL